MKDYYYDGIHDLHLRFYVFKFNGDEMMILPPPTMLRFPRFTAPSLHIYFTPPARLRALHDIIAWPSAPLLRA